MIRDGAGGRGEEVEKMGERDNSEKKERKIGREMLNKILFYFVKNRQDPGGIR